MRHPNETEKKELHAAARKMAKFEADLKLASAEYEVLQARVKEACDVPPHVAYDMGTGMWSERQQVKTEQGIQTVKSIYPIEKSNLQPLPTEKKEVG